MEFKREFFPSVRKTVMPRPYVAEEKDILGQSGIAWAGEAAVHGDNWSLDYEKGLIEVFESGAAISFRHLLPHKDKYKQERLYLRLKLAYRTTENANVNIRNFSGNHVTLPNSMYGNMYDDPQTYWYLTDDLTLNINSIYAGEKLWIQRVEWEWLSKEVIYEDEVYQKELELIRSSTEVANLYAPKEITENSVKDFLINRIKQDNEFAKRCLAMLSQDNLMSKDLTQLFIESGMIL